MILAQPGRLFRPIHMGRCDLDRAKEQGFAKEFPAILLNPTLVLCCFREQKKFIQEFMNFISFQMKFESILQFFHGMSIFHSSFALVDLIQIFLDAADFCRGHITWNPFLVELSNICWGSTRA